MLNWHRGRLLEHEPERPIRDRLVQLVAAAHESHTAVPFLRDGERLFCEAALANTRGAVDEQHLGHSRGAELQELVDQLQLALPTIQGRQRTGAGAPIGRHGRLGRRGCRRLEKKLVTAFQNAVLERLRLVRGVNAQFAIEHLPAELVLAEGPVAATEPGIHAHKRAVGLFVERLGRDDLLQPLNGAFRRT